MNSTIREKHIRYRALLEKIGLQNITHLKLEESGTFYLAGVDLGLTYFQFLIQIMDDRKEITKHDLDNLRKIKNPYIDKGLIITNAKITREAKRAKIQRNSIPIDILQKQL